MRVFDSRVELEVVLEEGVGGSLSGFDLTFHGPVLLTDNFSFQSVDLIVQICFFLSFNLILYLLIVHLHLSKMIKIILNMLIWILALFLIFVFSPFVLSVLFELFITKLLLKLLELFLIELIGIGLEVLVVFVELLAIKADVILPWVRLFFFSVLLLAIVASAFVIIVMFLLEPFRQLLLL